MGRPRTTSVTNEEAFARYRARLVQNAAGRNEAYVAGIRDPDILALTIIGWWAGRYAARAEAIAGRILHGAFPLADAGAAAAIVRRNRALDAATPAAVDWHRPFVIEAIDRNIDGFRRGGHPLDVTSGGELHGYGPSLRRLWLAAKQAGRSEVEAWADIKEWSLRSPPPAPSPAAALAAHSGRAASWRESGEIDRPWAATVDGRTWRIRLNDFPEEPMYGLEIDGIAIADFHDWPEAWERADAPQRPAKPAIKAPAAPAIARAAAARWPERYAAGEHEAVWTEMVSLGPDVRTKPYLVPAWAVAEETMRRARHNVELLVRRLDGLGYDFILPPPAQGWDDPVTLSFASPQGPALRRMSLSDAARQLLGADLSRIPPQARGSLDEFRESLRPLIQKMPEIAAARKREAERRREAAAATTDHLEDANVFLPATPEDARIMARLERQKRYVPLSVRAWIEKVGMVDLNGSHPALCFLHGPEFPEIYADPLAVLPLAEEVSDELASATADDPYGLLISLLDEDKAAVNDPELQRDEGYTIDIPNAAADAPLEGERHETTFVDYLRIAFRWGGFPGWERYEKRPERELKLLAEGLLPI